MLLWLVLAVMTAAVVGLLLHPLLAPGDRAAEAAEGSTAVYRDQLAEIDAEAARGLIGPNEAEAARREIARRLIASDTQSSGRSVAAVARGAASSKLTSRLIPRVAATIGLLVPIVALATYLQTGAPGLPAQPIAARRPPPPAANPELAKLIGAVEARLKENPEDGRGWDAIAPVYLRLARYAEAADAYGRANRLLGETPKRLAGLAESLISAEQGSRVGPEARAALTRLLQLEPGQVQARFWLAYGKEQDGDLEAAASDYDKLLADAPSDASWRGMVEERRQVVRSALAGWGSSASPSKEGTGKAGENSPPGASTAGPTAADVAAAERMSAGERQAMIDGMVNGLSARLEKDGRDLAGWERLIRALMVLGRKDDAVAALGRARQALADEPKALAALADLGKSLGLGT
jgi:cytochrome c-type biogenesis protein CcmH